MANQNAPHGFAPLITGDANDFNASCHMYYIPAADAAAYYIGDAVKTFTAGGGGFGSGATADADAGNIWGTFGIQRVQKSAGGATTERSRGIIISVFRNPFSLDTVNVPATKTIPYYVLVMDDPSIQMSIQANNAATWATALIGLNATFVVAAPTGISPVSATVLDTVTTPPAATNTLQLKILGVEQRINAANGPFLPLIVGWNTHELKGDTGSTPV
jgi:hypothetical protein